ncbi:MAG: hypothetical protein JJT89_05235 [Nitriliruptoraceae bacterium]|nr:hypothetical protein [Nitriliruptoraceae bacterium]
MILDGVTHALTRLDDDDPATITPADFGSAVEQRVIDTVAEWLQGAVG